MKKRTLLAVAVVMVVVMVCLCGCSIIDKLNGPETQFQNKIKNASEYSFHLYFLNTKTDNSSTAVNVDCFYKDGAYAYEYRLNDINDYRELFVDNKYYKILEMSDVAGKYNKTEDVSAESDSNLIYAATQKIFMASWATLLLKGEEDTVNDAPATEYSATYENVNYSLWFDSENLVKIKIVYSEGETYELTFTDYKFSEIQTESFTNPENQLGYTEGDFVFENWAAGWLR